MPEPFKNSFNIQIILGMAKHFQSQWSEFDSKEFSDAASKNLDTLELKERSDQIMHAMIKYLKTVSMLKKWAHDSDRHVRRLVSD